MDTNIQTETILSETANNCIAYNGQKILFSKDQALKQGTFISGMPNSGKSNLAKIVANWFMMQGYIVKCFDSSQTWIESDIPYYIVIENPNLNIDIPLAFNVTIDLSRILPNERPKIIGDIMDIDYQMAVAYGQQQWIIYILEESQMLIPSGSLRANKRSPRYSQVVFRMISEGRNYKQRYMMLTQRPADIETKALSRIGQAYIGQHWEVNDINKLTHLLGWKFNECREKLSSLKLGQFIYFNPYEKVRTKITTPEFHQSIRPQLWNEQESQRKQEGLLLKLLNKISNPYKQPKNKNRQGLM